MSLASLRIAVLEHVPFEGPAGIATWAAMRGHQVEEVPLYAGASLPLLASFDWLVVMGGPMGACDDADYAWLAPEKQLIRAAIDAGKTVLGVCLGAQIIANVLGARVYRAPAKEIGWWPVTWQPEALQTPLLRGFSPEQVVFQWHGDTFDLPDGAQWLASSDVCPNQAFLYAGRVLALQFHLETQAESAAALLAHCADDLAPGPWVQSAQAIVENADAVSGANAILLQLLDRLADQSAVS